MVEACGKEIHFHRFYSYLQLILSKRSLPLQRRMEIFIDFGDGQIACGPLSTPMMRSFSWRQSKKTLMHSPAFSTGLDKLPGL
jgi:hypothetical protein